MHYLLLLHSNYITYRSDFFKHKIHITLKLLKVLMGIHFETPGSSHLNKGVALHMPFSFAAKILTKNFSVILLHQSFDHRFFAQILL